MLYYLSYMKRNLKCPQFLISKEVASFYPSYPRKMVGLKKPQGFHGFVWKWGTPGTKKKHWLIIMFLSKYISWRYTMVYPIFNQTHFFKERIHDIQCKSRVDPTDESSTKGANIWYVCCFFWSQTTPRVNWLVIRAAIWLWIKIWHFEVSDQNSCQQFWPHPSLTWPDNANYIPVIRD